MMNSEAKSAAEREDPQTNPDLDRSMRLKLVIEEMLKDIDMSGEEWNDHDKDGVPYWEKYEERLRYMEENGI